MAKKKSTPKKSKPKKKSSWFRLPREGEISSFITGLVVVCLIGVVIWALVTSFFLGPSEEEKAELAQRVEESRLLVEDYQARGVISRINRKEEEVFVNAALWAELDRVKQEKLVASVADVIESKRCFVRDLSTKKTLAWHTNGSVFNETKEVGAEE